MENFRCGHPKTLENSYGNYSRCKICNNKRSADYSRKGTGEYHPQNSTTFRCGHEKSIENIFINSQKAKMCRICYERRMKKWYTKNKERILIKRREYYKDNPSKFRFKQKLVLYKISIEQYNNMLLRQSYKCAACQKPFLENETPAIDHDHSCCSGNKSCGKCVRGLIHRNCNTIEGLCKSDPEILQNIANYINRAKNSEK